MLSDNSIVFVCMTQTGQLCSLLPIGLGRGSIPGMDHFTCESGWRLSLTELSRINSKFTTCLLLPLLLSVNGPMEAFVAAAAGIGRQFV